MNTKNAASISLAAFVVGTPGATRTHYIPLRRSSAKMLFGLKSCGFSHITVNVAIILQKSLLCCYAKNCSFRTVSNRPISRILATQRLSNLTDAAKGRLINSSGLSLFGSITALLQRTSGSCSWVYQASSFRASPCPKADGGISARHRTEFLFRRARQSRFCSAVRRRRL